MTYWFETHDNCVQLATWLIGQGRLQSSQEALRFFEKPWHFDLEWDDYQQTIRGSSEEELGLDDPTDWAKL